MGRGSMFGLLPALTGEPLPGTQPVVAEGNFLRKGPVVFTISQKVVDQVCVGVFERTGLCRGSQTRPYPWHSSVLSPRPCPAGHRSSVAQQCGHLSPSISCGNCGVKILTIVWVAASSRAAGGNLARDHSLHLISTRTVPLTQSHLPSQI